MTASVYARRSDGANGGAMAQPATSVRYALAAILLAVGMADLVAMDLVLLPRYLAGEAGSSRLAQAPIAVRPVTIPRAAVTPVAALPAAPRVADVPVVLPPAGRSAVEAPAPVQPPPTQVAPTQAASVNLAGIEFPHLLFARNTSWLSPAARDILGRLATTLAENPSQRVVLSGHTDTSGPENLNRALSIERARRCGQWLEGRGVDPARMEIQGFGSTRPLVDDSSSEAQVHNRRVEIDLR
jgi:outer membrane protein OmpA-like peptidoglycan-associated protein